VRVNKAGWKNQTLCGASVAASYTTVRN